MKKFVRKIIIAFLLLVAFLLANYAINSYFIRHQEIRVDRTVLLMGGSHIKSGLNPKYIDDSQNIALPGETYFDTYYKLKYLVSNSSNHISKVLFGFGYNNICGLNDDKYVEEAMSIEYLERIYPIISYDILNTVGVNKIGYLKTIIGKMCLYPSLVHDGFIGEGFHGRSPNLMKSDAAKRVKHHYYKEDEIREESRRDIRYLDSIISFASRHDIEVVAVNIPQRKEYYSAVPQSLKQKYSEVRSSLIEKNIRIIDLLKMELDSSSFANHDHLSSEGAKIVSEIVSDSLAHWESIKIKN